MSNTIKKTTRLLTLKQTSEMLGVHPNTLRSWDDSGILIAVRIGTRRDRRYRLEDIKKFLKKQKG